MPPHFMQPINHKFVMSSHILHIKDLEAAKSSIDPVIK